MLPPITPGEILLDEYLVPMGISQNAMARAIGEPLRAINEKQRPDPDRLVVGAFLWGGARYS